MTIKKDSSIVDLLARLKLGERGWFVRDYWEADLCAVGISSYAHPLRLIYISTFNKSENEYAYELEQLASDNRDEYDCVGEEDSVDFDSLLSRMESFFR